MNPARYAVSFGMAGCYLPDSHYGAFECHTRSELADVVRSALAFYDMPKHLFDEFNIRDVWAFIKRHGSSTAHRSIYHKGMVLSFYGLTEAEFQAAEEEAA